MVREERRTNRVKGHTPRETVRGDKTRNKKSWWINEYIIDCSLSGSVISMLKWCQCPKEILPPLVSMTPQSSSTWVRTQTRATGRQSNYHVIIICNCWVFNPKHYNFTLSFEVSGCNVIHQTCSESPLWLSSAVQRILYPFALTWSTNLSKHLSAPMRTSETVWEGGRRPPRKRLSLLSLAEWWLDFIPICLRTVR